MPRRKTADSDTQRRGSAASYSRDNSVDRYAQTRRARKRKGGLRVFLVVLAVAFVATCGVALAYFANINSNLTSGIDSALRGTLTGSQAGDPFYMLLLGIDKNEDRVNDSEYGANDSAYRTDTMILARIDPTEKQVTLVSIHRDTLIDFGSDGGKQKINAAYTIGASKREAGDESTSGAAYTVETISKFADVPITHYAEIDFDQFCDVVNTIGGIEVNVPVDVYDPEYTGADIKAGWQTLDGDNALKLCRARHAYDNIGDGDVYRAANQRMVIGAILKKVLQSDIGTITSTINTLSQSVNTDFSVTDLLSLATQFQGFDMDTDLYSGMEPTTSKYVNETWYEICDTKAWQEMMTRVNQGLSPYSSEDEDITLGYAGSGTAIKNDDGSSSTSATTMEETVSESDATDYSGSVEVLNGAGVSGLAGRVSTTLSAYGFDTTAATADSWDYSTTRIIYVGDGNKAKAEAVALTLGLSTIQADDGTYSGEADVVVVLGADMADQ